RLGRGANPGTCPQGDRRAGMAVWWKSRSPIPLFKDPLRKFFMRQPWLSSVEVYPNRGHF
ncbi:MAG: hypothetical protein SOW92_03465, partial [Kiritimatiellia bacterium]|nr:hypothetical protein [Kiritimatiellia bacterium]